MAVVVGLAADRAHAHPAGVEGPRLSLWRRWMAREGSAELSGFAWAGHLPDGILGH
jgi:hypothetical protein